MTQNLLVSLQAELDERAAAGLLRKRRLLASPQGTHIHADGQPVLSFCSNDYLGLANHPALVSAMQQAVTEAGVGAGASHLITGHHACHAALEEQLADFVQLPAALLFPSGYMANMGVISALVGRNDDIFADKLNHASLNDAAVLSRAELHRYPHNDLLALEGLLKASHAPRRLVVVDAVFSMDGDLAPVPELLALCEQYNAWLLIDDAHGFGVLGKQGRGILSHFNLQASSLAGARAKAKKSGIDRVIYMATLGKAAGVYGAFVASNAVVIDYLIQQARTYIYTTATPPALAATTSAALNILAQEDARREHLKALIAWLKANLQLTRWSLADSITAIQPLMIGSNDEALALSEYLLMQHILVPAIRPPTVPKGSARLRISLSAAHAFADLERLVAVLLSAEKAL